MKRYQLKLILLYVLILLISSVSISQSSPIEILPNETNFIDGFSHQAIAVPKSNDELIAEESELINNPKIPYSLGFVSESFSPTQKIDERLILRLEDLRQGKISSFSNYSESNYTYGFVMILGRVTPDKLQNLSNYGVNLLGYHSGHSYKFTP